MSEIGNYEIKTAKTGQKVPVVDGVHLHSIYNPERETETIIEQYKNSMNSNPNILVLGLGFGYHINAIKKYMESTSHKDFNIYIIEPNEQVYRDADSHNPIESRNIKVFCGSDVHELYSDKEMISFLLKKPVIIPHAPSFSLYKDFFKNYLSYKAPTKLEDINIKVESEALSLYLSQFGEEKTIEDCFLEVIQRKKFNNRFDLAFIAFAKMCDQIERVN